MFLFYNFLQVLIAPLLTPLLLIIAVCFKKYRYRTPSRLSFGLHKKIPYNPSPPVFWVHALSIGETISALPLVDGLKRAIPECTIVFSVTTMSGRKAAEQIMRGHADYIIDSPFDILPVVCRFISFIKPDCFILVETDFWPNLLYSLKKRNIPIVLVNGRVSDKAFADYKKTGFFFKRMFQIFDILCCQTENDRNKLYNLGVPTDRLHILGNLKFDTYAVDTLSAKVKKERTALINSLCEQIPGNRICLIAGSTHKGEEEIILQALQSLSQEFPQIYVIIAPRTIARSEEIVRLCSGYGFQAILRTQPIDDRKRDTSTVFILDTIGELAACYTLGAFSFVGGSLVKEGGHNPIEPALTGQPVLFGKSMEDFSEIADDLLKVGGAFMIDNSDDFAATLRSFINYPESRQKAGEAAQRCVMERQGVIDRHIAAIISLTTSEE